MSSTQFPRIASDESLAQWIEMLDRRSVDILELGGGKQY